MDYSLGPVILSSQDKIRMLDFLSDVFEFDVDTETDIITQGNLAIKIVDSHHDEVFPAFSGVTFAFMLKTPEQIKEIENKFKFFVYRKAQDPNNDRFAFFVKETGTGLVITDFDGRSWRFDLPPRVIHEL